MYLMMSERDLKAGAYINAQISLHSYTNGSESAGFIPQKFLILGQIGLRKKVQTPIRLLLKEQSDQGLHYLPLQLHLLDVLLH